MFGKFKELKSDLSTYGIGLLQAKAFRILKQKTTSSLKPYGISTVDWALLGLLYEQKNGLRMRAVANSLGVEAPFVTQTLASLLKKGLIQKIGLPNDARVKILQLTESGRKLVPSVEAHLRKEMRHLLTGSSVREVLAYRAVLKTIIDNEAAPH